MFCDGSDCNEEWNYFDIEVGNGLTAFSLALNFPENNAKNWTKQSLVFYSEYTESITVIKIFIFF